MRILIVTALVFGCLAAPVEAASSSTQKLTPFQEYNPDIDKYAFAKSFIMGLGAYGRLNQRLLSEAEVEAREGWSLKTVRMFVDDRTMDNAEIRVAKNYLFKYATSKNMLIRRVAYDMIMAYEKTLLISSRERKLWQTYYRFKKMGIPADLNEGEFKKQVESLVRDRKSVGVSMLEAIRMLRTVLLSAQACRTEDCKMLVLTQTEREKLVTKLDEFAGDNLAWGVKAGQGTFEAAVASVREVLEDPVFVARK